MLLKCYRRMETKIFKDKKILIRMLEKKDLKNIKDFLEYINSFGENDKLTQVEKISEKQERDYLESAIKRQKNKTGIYLFAEHEGKIVGATDFNLGRFRGNHVGKFGIRIREGYRGMGLGTYLISEVIRMAIENLKPTPKILRLETFENNKPAISLYQKIGFKIVARIPKQREYKGKLIAEVVMLKYL